jgi:hypothetical protein
MVLDDLKNNCNGDELIERAIEEIESLEKAYELLFKENGAMRTKLNAAADPRKALELAVINAATNLFAHMGAAGFCLPIPNTNPEVIVAAGERISVIALLKKVDA